MSFLSSSIRAVTRLAHCHPLIWHLTWKAAHVLRFLLPHDRSYLALRHFIALAPTGLFLDVGANTGISVLSFRRMSRKHEILSLEPNGFLEPSLRKIAKRDSGFRYIMSAAGARAERLTLHVPIYHGTPLHPLASLDRDQALEGVAASFGQRIAASTRIATVSANVITVDSLGVAPVIIKVDAEGHELPVLTGAKQTIEKHRPFLMLEMAWNDSLKITTLLHEMRYNLCSYDAKGDCFISPPHITPSAEGGNHNLFAIPDEKTRALPLGDFVDSSAPQR